MAYQIQKGDTLSQIALNNNTTVANLQSYNPQITDPNKIYAGQSLNLAPIAVNSLTNPQTPAQLPAAPVSSPITLSNVMPQAPTDTIPDYLKAYLDTPAPTNPLDNYNSLNQSLGIDEKTQKVNDLTAQLNNITAGQQVEELKLPSEGISERGIQTRSISLERENAIKAIPIQAQLLAAQGNLGAAQQKLSQVFEIQTDYNKQLYDYKQKLRDAVFQYADREQQRKLEEKAKEDDRNFTLLRDNINNAREIAVKAGEGGDWALAAQITQLDPKSPTYSQDLAKLQSKIRPDASKALDNQYKSLQIQKLQQDIAGTGTQEDPANIIAYAQQYASTGTIPTGLPKGSFGLVSQVAKDLPKIEGEIVDNNTNIKSSKLGSAKADGLAAMRDLTIKVNQAKTLFSKLNTGLIGGLLGNIRPSTERQQYNILKGEIVDLLSRARSGAALTETEIAEYQKKLPGTFNRSLYLGKSGDVLLQGLQKSISDKLDTSLRAQGVSMYGFSKVRLGGKEYTVGDIINVNGSQGRVNPDGSITPIN